MDPTMVRLSPDSTRTRVLITRGPMDIGKVVLPPAKAVHRRAASTLLEGLSLFLGERLSVVLCVDESCASSCELGLLDGLGCGERSVFYEVGVAVRQGRTGRRGSQALRLPDGDFRDLRQLTWEWTR